MLNFDKSYTPYYNRNIDRENGTRPSLVYLIISCKMSVLWADENLLNFTSAHKIHQLFLHFQLVVLYR